MVSLQRAAWRAPAILALSLAAFSCAAPRDERTRSRCSCAALRQLQRGFSFDDERADRRRPRAWSRAAGVGTPDALRGWSVPLVALASMMTTNRTAPGGARQRRAAHVRPRCTCRPNARVIGTAPHSMLVRLETIATRCRVRCTRALGRTTGYERADGRVARWNERFTASERGADVAACTIAFLFARACNCRDTPPIRAARANRLDR